MSSDDLKNVNLSTKCKMYRNLLIKLTSKLKTNYYYKAIDNYKYESRKIRSAI